MTNKYENAIFQYEWWRQEISNISTFIGMAGNFNMDDDGHGGGTRCTDLKNQAQAMFDSTCVERYWNSRKEAVDEDGEPFEPEPVELCSSCRMVDRLVQERKRAKQQFGVAKRRISQLGKGIIQ